MITFCLQKPLGRQPDGPWFSKIVLDEGRAIQTFILVDTK